MRTLFYFMMIFMSFFIVYACNADHEIQKTEVQSALTQPVDYSLIGRDGYVVFLKTNGSVHDDIYILKNDLSLNVRQNYQVAGIKDLNNGIDIRLDDGSHLKMTVDADPSAQFNGYALSRVSGEYYFLKFYGNGNPLDDPDVGSVRCNCVQVSVSKNCDAGGQGSTECSIEHHGNVVGTGVGFKCNVKCGSGYYSCCKSI